MPSFEELDLVLACAETPNFAAVAARLHVSQSTVSRAVQRIEAALGAPLFERASRGVRLRNDAGPRIDGLRDLVERWNRLSDGSRSGGSLRIFCTVTASQTFAADLLTSFRKDYPDVALELRTGPASDALEAARTGAVDTAIAPLPTRLPAGMVSAPITSTPLVAIAARGLHSPARWWTVGRLVLPRTGLTRELADRWRRGVGRDFEIQEAETHEEVVVLTSLGSGVGIVPELVVRSSSLRPRLQELTPPRDLPTMRIGLCARRAATSDGPLAALWSMVTDRAL